MAESPARQNDDAHIAQMMSRLAGDRPVANKPRRDPLDELVLTVLSQNTTDANAARGWEGLRGEFPEWRSVLAAGRKRVERAIRPAGLAKRKAGTIVGILEHLERAGGRMTLEHLREMDDEQALLYLTGLRGVGLKTAACVLCFALGRPVIPVDTHVHRVARRLGLVPRASTPEGTHRILNETVPSELRYELHMLLIRHGREICRARTPRCDACPVAGQCPRIGVEPRG